MNARAVGMTKPTPAMLAQQEARRQTPYRYKGKVLYGIAAVCEASGRPRRTVHWHLQRFGHLDFLNKKETQ